MPLPSINGVLKYPACPEESKYERIAKIGHGTYGEVFKAKDRKTGRLVAMKKILTEKEKEGFPMTALREIKILQALQHDNIVNLIEICRNKVTPYNKHEKAIIYLVFEFCEHDLCGLILSPTVKFTLAEIKCVLQQLLNGLYFIHGNKMIHRDLKSANILVTKAGKIKLADFGLARSLCDQKCFTSQVVTLWYRSPELLLGEKSYGPAIDIWSVGCIMGELWTRLALMKGSTEQGQLDEIIKLCGSIDAEIWPDVNKLPLYNKMMLPKGRRRQLTELMEKYVKDKLALDLLDQLLTYDPAKRIDVDSALDHDFFWVDPLPQDLKPLLSKFGTSMFHYFDFLRAGAMPPVYNGARGNDPNQHVEHTY